MPGPPDCLRRGGLVAFPTETVYGLGVNALDRAAVRRLFAAKQRPANDPLIVHVTSIDSIAASRRACRRREHARRRFWPGPLTLVVPVVVPDEVTAGLATVAVRVPRIRSHALLDAAAVPVAAPSANLFSRPSPTLASHVLDDLGGRIDLVVDGGPTTIGGVESTVLDLTSDPPTILRPGAVTADMLRQLPLRWTCLLELRRGNRNRTPPCPRPGCWRSIIRFAQADVFRGRGGGGPGQRSLIRCAREPGFHEAGVVGIIAAKEDREELARSHLIATR